MNVQNICFLFITLWKYWFFKPYQNNDHMLFTQIKKSILIRWSFNHLRIHTKIFWPMEPNSCKHTYTHSCRQKLPSTRSPTLWQQPATNRTHLHFQRRLRFCVAPRVNKCTCVIETDAQTQSDRCSFCEGMRKRRGKKLNAQNDNDAVGKYDRH